MSFDTQKGTREGIEVNVRAGDIDASSVESTSDSTCRAKRYSDNQYWEFKMAADDFRAWRSISYGGVLAKLGRAIFGNKMIYRK